MPGPAAPGATQRFLPASRQEPPAQVESQGGAPGTPQLTHWLRPLHVRFVPQSAPTSVQVSVDASQQPTPQRPSSQQGCPGPPQASHRSFWRLQATPVALQPKSQQGCPAAPQEPPQEPPVQMGSFPQKHAVPSAWQRLASQQPLALQPPRSQQGSPSSPQGWQVRWLLPEYQQTSSPFAQRSPGQQGSPEPPQVAQVPAAQTEPVGHADPAQQGSPAPPQG